MLQRITDLGVLVNTVMNIRAPLRTELLEKLNNEDLHCDLGYGVLQSVSVEKSLPCRQRQQQVRNAGDHRPD